MKNTKKRKGATRRNKRDKKKGSKKWKVKNVQHGNNTRHSDKEVAKGKIPKKR